MVEKSRRDRVGLGLIGLGPCWEQFYREPIVRMQSRLTIRLVYDPVEARAKSVAGEFEADVAGSLRQILTRHSLQGLLVLDPGWCGSGTLELIARSGKPTFLGKSMLRDTSQWVESRIESPNLSAHDQPFSNQDDLLMPELGLRFTPASCRLRELIATKLGPVKTIEIHCDLAVPIEETAALIDWCIDIMGQPPGSAMRTTNDGSNAPQLELEFPPVSSSRSLSDVVHRTAVLQQQTDTTPTKRISLKCERGHALMTDRTHIAWSTSQDSADESLTDERTEIEILIDQFCRRALGGLNPIGRLSEYARAVKIVESLVCSSAPSAFGKIG